MSTESPTKSSKRRKGSSAAVSPRHKFPIYYARENVIREQTITSRRVPVADVFDMALAKSCEDPAASADTHALYLSQVGPTGDPLEGTEVEMDPACRMKHFMAQINDGCLVIFQHRRIPVSFSFTKTFLVSGGMALSEAVSWMMRSAPGAFDQNLLECGDQLFPSDSETGAILAGHKISAASLSPSGDIDRCLPLVPTTDSGTEAGEVSEQSTIAEALGVLVPDEGQRDANSPVIRLIVKAEEEDCVLRVSSNSSTDEAAGSFLESSTMRCGSAQNLRRSSQQSSDGDDSHLPGRRGSSDQPRGVRRSRKQVQHGSLGSLRSRSRSCTDSKNGGSSIVQRQQSLSCSPPSTKSRYLAPESPTLLARRKGQVTHSQLGVNPDSIPTSAPSAASVTSPRLQREVTSPRSPRDLIKRLSTMVKRRDSRVLNKVFGVPLTVVMERPWESGTIPGAMRALINWLAEHDCWKTKGIFRCSGSHEAVTVLKDYLDTEINCSVPEDSDVIVVGEVLKIYLQELPIALVPNRFLRNFINAASLSDKKHLRLYMSALVASLPQVHREALYCLLRILRAVHDNKETSSMSSENLGICFGPLIFQPVDNNITEYVHHSKYCSLAATYLVEHLESLFDKNTRPIQVSRASSSYTAASPDELSVEKGQLVTVIIPVGKLWFCDLDGRFGLVPETLFDNLSDATPQASTGTPVIPTEYHSKTDEEFLEQFRCSKDIFRCLPPWKQQELVRKMSN